MDLKEFFEGFSRVKGTALDKHLMKLHYDLLRENRVLFLAEAALLSLFCAASRMKTSPSRGEQPQAERSC